MGRQLTTAISDGVLALTCYRLVLYLMIPSIYAGLGFAIQAVAATVGVLRFASDRPSNTVVRWHDYSSWFAAVAGMPLIAVAFCKYVLPYMMNFNFMASMGLILMNGAMDTNMQKLSKQAVSGFAMLTILLSCFYSANVYGFVAAALYVVAAPITGLDGNIHIGRYNIPRLDAFHYVLVAANLLFFKALYRF
ncbi:uncharacterized protein LOC121388350 [Gigantopelta aegis]|uniref:uncharacterized protein LOC121388350 n=1 Tax=Gigantopelta aegis TaxID=1735272 RepID=UPI001B88D33C|nr:uncharacterized protein LOC121388350 [Gigantopelta aegis]